MQSTDCIPKYQARYARIASEESNRILNLENWEKGQALNEQLKEQSHEIARKLETVKLNDYQIERVEGRPYLEKKKFTRIRYVKSPTYFQAYDESDLTFCGLNTEQTLSLPEFRNISVIPYVARKNRRSMLLELEYYLQGVEKPRTWVHTTGKRCSIEEAEERFKKVHRKISKINYEKFMKRAGASFVFRSGELGEIVKTETGLNVHPHIHSVLVLRRRLPKREWSQLLQRIRSYFGAHSQDCGVIQDVRELVKYVCKPSDLEHLDGQDLHKLYQLTKSVRMVECLRNFRKLRRRIRETNHKVVRRQGTLKCVKKWNSKNTPESPQWLTQTEVVGPADPSVVSWCVPSAVFTPVTEPCFIVHGLGAGDPSKIFEMPEVLSMRKAIIVHTKALTVRRENAKSEKKINEISQSKPKVPL